MAEDAKTPDVRMAELLAALSLGIDLASASPWSMSYGSA